jgi:hypothetical protein
MTTRYLLNSEKNNLRGEMMPLGNIIHESSDDEDEGEELKDANDKKYDARGDGDNSGAQ